MESIKGSFAQKRKLIVEETIARHFKEDPDLKIRYGDYGASKYIQDMDYHLRYLDEAIAAQSPVLFEDYLSWVAIMLTARNVSTAELLRSLEILASVLRDHCPSDGIEIALRYLNAGIGKVIQDCRVTPSFLSEDSTLARQYLDALLQGDRNSASRLILDAVRDGMPVKDIYIKIFQESQHEIGRLWQLNKITVAQEHFCTAATQMIMSQLYPYIFTTPRKGLKLVAACVTDELHDIGIHIVADFFEMDGWDTTYLGANTPTKDIIRTIIETKSNMVGLSATIAYHLHDLRHLIRSIRADEACRGTFIMVGGYPFNKASDLWRDLGADASARDAAEAVCKANRFFNTRSQQ